LVPGSIAIIISSSGIICLATPLANH